MIGMEYTSEAIDQAVSINNAQLSRKDFLMGKDVP